MPEEERRDAPPDGEHPTRSRLLLRALTTALMALAVLQPPETYAWSGAACKVLLAAAAGCVWLRAEGAPLLPAWTAGLLPLALAAVALSSCRSRALDEASEALALILAALLGRALASDSKGRAGAAGLLVALGSVAAVLAMLQHHVTYREELKALLAAPGTASPYVIARLGAGRPSGPFSLPAALAGFFALTLPLTLLWARRGADRWQRLAGVAAALLQGYALFLTRSVGGLAATALALVLSLPTLAPRRRRVLLLALPLAAVAIGLLFLQARRVEVGAPGGDPLTLRAGNWRAAAEMIRDHPLFGTGPGSFGTFYPRYMRPGMNETRYAHNTYLQVISGWGPWAVVPLSCLVLAFTGRLRRAWRERKDDLPFVAGGAAFLAHNLIDFTAYLPGVAIPAAILFGFGLERPADATPEAFPPGRRTRRGALRSSAAAAALLIVYLSHSLLCARAEILFEQARTAAAEGSTQEALALARRAARARPDDPVPHAFIAEWILRHGMSDETLRREGKRQAERALRLDPESAILHSTLSFYLRAAHETAAAYREQSVAHLLFPLKEEYRLPRSPDDGWHR